MKYLCGPATVSEEILSRKPLAASREGRQNLRFTSQETCTKSEKRMTLTETAQRSSAGCGYFSVIKKQTQVSAARFFVSCLELYRLMTQTFKLKTIFFPAAHSVRIRFHRRLRAENAAFRKRRRLNDQAAFYFTVNIIGRTLRLRQPGTGSAVNFLTNPAVR